LLPQGALAKMGGLAAAKGMMFAGSANDVYKDLKRFQRWGKDAIPARYFDRGLSDYHHINHEALKAGDVLHSSTPHTRVTDEIKDVSDTLLEMYFGEPGSRGYGKVPQLNPERAFKGVDELSIFPIQDASGRSTINTTKPGVQLYNESLSNHYLRSQLTPVGNVPDYTSAILIDSTIHGRPKNVNFHYGGDPIEEAVRRLKLGTLAEHESVHTRQMKGLLTQKEMEVHNYLKERLRGDTYNDSVGAQFMPLDAGDRRHQLKSEIHNALIPNPEVSLYQNWTHVKPGSFNTAWSNRPDEMLATTLGVGNAGPGILLKPGIREELDTPITRFLRYGNFER
jgi:hypothetical protein